MSNNLKSTKPTPAIIQIWLPVTASARISGTATKVIACPATSSATTSRGSSLPVAAIAAGANAMQMTDPAAANSAIRIETDKAGAPNWQDKPKIIAGGSEPHVPGATGSRPRPKHDVSSIFIATES